MGMRALRLADRGRTFATRLRAAEVVRDIDAGTSAPLEVDFSGVEVATPSFLDEFFGQLATRVRTLSLTGVSPELDAPIAEILERRGLSKRFRMCAATK